MKRITKSKITYKIKASDGLNENQNVLVIVSF